MSKKRVAKVITNKEDIEYLASMTEKEAQKLSTIMDMFGEFNGKKRFNTYDIVTMPPGTYGPKNKRNKKPITTTVGLWVFNKFMIEEDLADMYYYINEPITKSKYKSISEDLSYALIEDKIPLETLKTFLLKCQKCQPYGNILFPSFTTAMLTISDAIEKKKKELLSTKYKGIVESGDVVAADKLQKELLDYAKELLKDDPSMDIYNSEAKSSFGNNFKDLFVMKGATKDPRPGKGYKIVTSSFMNGVSRDEYQVVSASLAEGAYARGKKTAIGGYYEKLFLRSFQHISLDKEGSDCGTKRYVEVHLTSKNINMFMYNYIVEGSKLVELTYDLIPKYTDKTVKMRFSSMCEGKKICSKCAGNLFYRLGIVNVGAATPQIASKLKNISMKAFHNSQLDLYDINVEDAFSDGV